MGLMIFSKFSINIKMDFTYKTFQKIKYKKELDLVL